MVTLAPNLRSVVSNDGAVILDTLNNRITTLDATGAYVWARLQRGMQVETIVAALVRDTGGDEVNIAKDVDEFVANLSDTRLLTHN